MSMSAKNSSMTEALQTELIDKNALVERVRAELIKSQITILELQDAVLQRETDKADAVALLGRAELVLEGKINYIFELDRVLNEKIAALESAFATARADHETITGDLVQKLDQANREIGATHTLAGNYAREAAQVREELGAAEKRFAESELAFGQLRAEFDLLTQNHSAARELIASIRADLTNATSTAAARAQELDLIRRSFVWKITAPLRAIFGPQ